MKHRVQSANKYSRPVTSDNNAYKDAESVNQMAGLFNPQRYNYIRSKDDVSALPVGYY